jgi:hypothetical protein
MAPPNSLEKPPMSKLPDTQYAVLLKCVNATRRGRNFVPTGSDFKRAHALVRRGLLAPVHGRRGEGEEWFLPTQEAETLFPKTEPLRL